MGRYVKRSRAAIWAPPRTLIPTAGETMKNGEQLWLICALVALLQASCDKEQIQETVNKGVEQTTTVVEQTVETVKQEANLAGSMELSTDPPITAKACYAELIDTGENYPNVFRLASYRSEELERFPSIIVEAHVEEASLSALSGKTLSAKVYARLSEDGQLYSTSSDAPANITIVSVEEKSLTCECTANLSSVSGEATSVTGKFVGRFE